MVARSSGESCSCWMRDTIRRATICRCWNFSPTSLSTADRESIIGILVATKTDKLPRASVPKRVRELAEAAGVEEDQIIAFSAVTGLGRTELAEAIVSLVATKDG